MLVSLQLLIFFLPEFKIITAALKQGEEQTFAIWLKIPPLFFLKDLSSGPKLGFAYSVA